MPPSDLSASLLTPSFLCALLPEHPKKQTGFYSPAAAAPASATTTPVLCRRPARRPAALDRQRNQRKNETRKKEGKEEQERKRQRKNGTKNATPKEFDQS